MRYIRYAILALIAIVLISVSLANRDVVTLRLVPEALAGLLGVTWAISLPLFIVVLGGVALGLIVGFIWEWLREHKHRREVSTKTRELDKLEREVKHLKRGSREEKDEVLALLD
ncbi:lipopolysaccharide assembly protein LapA domain-containing protein [Albibacillus kandeliae]|uniref:lipopolysaccharide assembly protein LapA domain-containing protein n=1 Tax=Albibacillus kandeliae TaxID=2174228 RepID=UPI000D68D70F|nr:LapA family protein [Albibacillus kandeliae]